MSKLRSLQLLVLAMVAVVCYTSNTSTARPFTPGVCDRLCKQVSYAYQCGNLGMYRYYQKSSCWACRNQGDTECVNGDPWECKDELTTPNVHVSFLYGTNSNCNCNAGIVYIEAVTAWDEVARQELYWRSCQAK